MKHKFAASHRPSFHLPELILFGCRMKDLAFTPFIPVIKTKTVNHVEADAAPRHGRAQNSQEGVIDF